MTSESNLLKDRHPELIDELVDQSLAPILTYGSTRRVDWKCPRGHVWRTEVKNRSRGNGCPICKNGTVIIGYNDLDTTHPQLAEQLADKGDGRKVSAETETRVKWACPEGHIWADKVTNRINGSTCSVCKWEHEWLDDLAQISSTKQIKE